MLPVLHKMLELEKDFYIVILLLHLNNAGIHSDLRERVTFKRASRVDECDPPYILYRRDPQ